MIKGIIKTRAPEMNMKKAPVPSIVKREEITRIIVDISRNFLKKLDTRFQRENNDPPVIFDMEYLT